MDVAFVVAAIETNEVLGVLGKVTLVTEDVEPKFNVVAFGTLRDWFLIVAVPVVAPIVTAVPSPAKLTVVATVL